MPSLECSVVQILIFVSVSRSKLFTWVINSAWNSVIISFERNPCYSVAVLFHLYCLMSMMVITILLSAGFMMMFWSSWRDFITRRSFFIRFLLLFICNLSLVNLSRCFLVIFVWEWWLLLGGVQCVGFVVSSLVGLFGGDSIFFFVLEILFLCRSINLQGLDFCIGRRFFV